MFVYISANLSKYKHINNDKIIIPCYFLPQRQTRTNSHLYLRPYYLLRQRASWQCEWRSNDSANSKVLSFLPPRNVSLERCVRFYILRDKTPTHTHRKLGLKNTKSQRRQKERKTKNRKTKAKIKKERRGEGNHFDMS